MTPYQRELAIMRTGFACGSKFVFSQHCKAARAAGVPGEKIAAIGSWAASATFDADDRALLTYVDHLALEDGRVQDATFAALKRSCTDEAILELTYTIGTYRMHAMMSRALRLEYDDIDERIVEVAMPGQDAADVMGQISR